MKILIFSLFLALDKSNEIRFTMTVLFVYILYSSKIFERRFDEIANNSNNKNKNSVSF